MVFSFFQNKWEESLVAHSYTENGRPAIHFLVGKFKNCKVFFQINKKIPWKISEDFPGKEIFWVFGSCMSMRLPNARTKKISQILIEFIFLLRFFMFWLGSGVKELHKHATPEHPDQGKFCNFFFFFKVQKCFSFIRAFRSCTFTQLLNAWAKKFIFFSKFTIVLAILRLYIHKAFSILFLSLKENSKLPIWDLGSTQGEIPSKVINGHFLFRLNRPIFLKFFQS